MILEDTLEQRALTKAFVAQCIHPRKNFLMSQACSWNKFLWLCAKNTFMCTNKFYQVVSSFFACFAQFIIIICLTHFLRHSLYFREKRYTAPTNWYLKSLIPLQDCMTHLFLLIYLWLSNIYSRPVFYI